MKTNLNKLARLVTIRDFLLYQRNLELRAEYASKLGQYELYEAKLSCDVDRMRRKLALAEQKINEGIDFEEASIDEQLELEFIGQEQLIEEMTSNLMIAERFQCMSPISRESQSEMLSIYQQLVNIYYPGLYPDDKKKEEKWREIQGNFQQRDLNALERIKEETEQNSSIQDSENQIESEQLKTLCDILQLEVDETLQRFPFNIKELLEDEEQIEKHREGIRRKIEKDGRELKLLQKKAAFFFGPISKNLS